MSNIIHFILNCLLFKDTVTQKDTQHAYTSNLQETHFVQSINDTFETDVKRPITGH